jgi:hypothetical protein
MKTDGEFTATARGIRMLLWAILAAGLLDVGYRATRFGDAEAGEVVGVLALIVVGLIVVGLAIQMLALCGKWLKGIANQVEAERRNEHKPDLGRES